MMEPLFASAGPAWPGTPAIGFAWPAVNRPFGIPGQVSQPFSPAADPYDLNRLTAPRPFLAALAPDITSAYTVPTLLAAVAVRRGQPLGPTNDQEIEDFVYDALELLPGTGDVEVRVDGGRVTLTGLVQHKRVKRDIGEIVWGIPIVNDVQNNVSITSRRRARTQGREAESQQAAGRKQG